jgi:hypothetical protein
VREEEGEGEKKGERKGGRENEERRGVIADECWGGAIRIY